MPAGAVLVLWMQRAGPVMVLVMIMSGRIAALRARSRLWLWILLALYVTVWSAIVIWRFAAGPAPFMG